MLDLYQEREAETAIEVLKKSVAVTATVLRDGRPVELPVKDIVRGDVVRLRTGDLVPADGFVITSRDALTNEASPTGQPYPCEKKVGECTKAAIAEAYNALFAGTSVVSGGAAMLVAETGAQTMFGEIAASVQAREPMTAFEPGVHHLGMLIMRPTAFLALFVLDNPCRASCVSTNFGNMLSMALASLILPFLPLTPLQILINNLLYDLSEIGIPFDAADEKTLSRPQTWDVNSVLGFTLIMGPLSSLFDVGTFLVLSSIFKVNAHVFQTAWFVESIATQILVIFIIRTGKPFWATRPNAVLVASSLGALAGALLISLTPVGRFAGFVPVPGAILAAIIVITIAYLAAAEALKPFALRWAPKGVWSLTGTPGGVRGHFGFK